MFSQRRVAHVYSTIRLCCQSQSRSRTTRSRGYIYVFSWRSLLSQQESGESLGLHYGWIKLPPDEDNDTDDKDGTCESETCDCSHDRNVSGIPVAMNGMFIDLAAYLATPILLIRYRHVTHN